MLTYPPNVKPAWITYNCYINSDANTSLMKGVFVKGVVNDNFIAIGLIFRGYICATKRENGSSS